MRRRRSTYADRLLAFPDFVFSDGAEFQRRGCWHGFFRDRIGPVFDGRIIFEIGCNDAALLTRVAAKYSATAFIGIDWKCRAIHTAATHIAAAGLRNVVLLHGRAQDIRRFFADGELHELWLFHPDPCDKPRELRNRLMTESFLLEVHAVLRPGGALVLKTDHPGYHQWVLGLLGLPKPDVFKHAREWKEAAARPVRMRVRDLMSPEDVPAPSTALAQQFEVSAHSADFWNDDAARRASAGRCFAGEATGFETRFVRKRLPIYYLEVIKPPHIA